jgi:hypothetical protein
MLSTLVRAEERSKSRQLGFRQPQCLIIGANDTPLQNRRQFVSGPLASRPPIRSNIESADGPFGGELSDGGKFGEFVNGGKLSGEMFDDGLFDDEVFPATSDLEFEI